MQTIVLAGRTDDSLGPLSAVGPTATLPAGDRPLVARVADAAVTAGATSLRFVVDAESPVIDYFGPSHRGVPVDYTVCESRDRYSAVVEALGGGDGPFAILDGRNHYAASEVATLFDRVPAAGFTLSDRRPGHGVLDATDGVVTRVERGNPEREPAPPRTVFAGAVALPATVREVLAGRRQLGRMDTDDPVTGVLAQANDRTAVDAVEFESWRPVQRPADLLSVTEDALTGIDRRIEGSVADHAEIRGDVVVERGASVDAGVVIEGPVVVQSGGSVGPNAFVRGGTVIGRDATVGHAVEVKNSLLFREATVNHLSYVGDSLIGPGANLGAGTNVANLRHDGNPVRAGPTGHSTGRRKFGAVVGPRVKTGIDTSIYPGAWLPPETRTPPNARVRPDGEVVRANEE